MLSNIVVLFVIVIAAVAAFWLALKTFKMRAPAAKWGGTAGGAPGDVEHESESAAASSAERSPSGPAVSSPGGATLDGTPMTLEDIEKRAIAQALVRSDGNLSQVCRELGIGRTTLYRKLKKYELR